MLGHFEQSRGQPLGTKVVATLPHAYDHLLHLSSIVAASRTRSLLALQAACMHQARQTLAMQPGHLLHFCQELAAFLPLGGHIAPFHPFQIRASFTHRHLVFGPHGSPHSVTFSFAPPMSRTLPPPPPKCYTTPTPH